MVPIIKTKDIVTSVAFFTKEELDAMAAAVIANLKTGEAILHASGSAPARVSFPYAADPFIRTPNFARKKESEHRALQQQNSMFATIDEIQQQRRLLLDALLQRLQAINDRHEFEPRLLNQPPLVDLPAEARDTF